MILSLDQIKMSLTTLSTKDQQTATQLIMTNEGFKSYVYDDKTAQAYEWDNSAGNPTWLYGINLKAGGDAAMGYLLTTYRMGQIESDLIASLNFFQKMPTSVKIALFDMTYTLGLTKLLGFKDFLGHLKAENYKLASLDITDSKWYTKATLRAQKDQMLILKAS